MKKISKTTLSIVITWLALLCNLSQACYAQPDPSTSPNYQRAHSNINPSSIFQPGDTNGLSGLILFSSNVAGFERIFVFDLNARRVRLVIQGPGNNSYPSWDPKGRSFSFTSDRDGNNEIYISDWNGDNQRRLTNNQVTDDNSAWSTDGKWITYYSESKNGKSSNIFMLDPLDPTPIQVTKFSGRNTTPQFTPDNKSITYSTNRFWPGWDICSWNLESKKEQCNFSGAKTYCRPRYSPTGRYLAYSWGAFNEIDLAMLDLKTNQNTYLTQLPGKEYDPTFGPDNRHIAFVAENGRKNIYNIFVIDDKKKVRQILSSDNSIRFLSWSGTQTMQLEADRLRHIQTQELQEQTSLHPSVSSPTIE